MKLKQKSATLSENPPPKEKELRPFYFRFQSAYEVKVIPKEQLHPKLLDYTQAVVNMRNAGRAGATFIPVPLHKITNEHLELIYSVW